MTGRRNGWITARSQITFVVGLVIAVGVIFWLELVQFRNADDPFGDSWVVAVDLPAARAGDAEPEWLRAASAVVAGGGDAVAIAMVAAACGATGACVTPPESVANAMARLSGDPAAWGDDIRGPVALAALASLLGVTPTDQALAAWAAARAQVVSMPAAAITSQPGQRQFAARAAALSGRDLAAARRLTDLRDVFEPADGLSRLGAARSVALAEGLGLLLAVFPDTGSVRQLFWRTYDEWPFGLSATPVSLLALWWSAFDVADVDAELTSRMAAATPFEAAIAVLAASSVEHGPLLARAP